MRPTAIRRSRGDVALLQHQASTFTCLRTNGFRRAPLRTATSTRPRHRQRQSWARPFRLEREGFTIICSEPTAALMLKQDYLDSYL